MHRAADNALTIPGAQRPKGQRGDDGQPAQGHKSAMQCRDDREAIGLRKISKIPCRHQRSECQAEAHGDLLKRAGYRARHARFIRFDVRVGHAVHAGKLQRINRRGKVYPTRLRLGRVGASTSASGQDLAHVTQTAFDGSKRVARFTLTRSLAPATRLGRSGRSLPRAVPLFSEGPLGNCAHEPRGARERGGEASRRRFGAIVRC